MTFLKLTKKTYDDEEEHVPVLVNLDKICNVYPWDIPDETFIEMDGASVIVTESYEEVARLIEMATLIEGM